MRNYFVISANVILMHQEKEYLPYFREHKVFFKKKLNTKLNDIIAWKAKHVTNFKVTIWD